ncbi:MAG TPA: metallophosphoesterase family protein [Bacteroidales bacterium]|jgi:putative phosphoesterase|nr:metallophosphoesterase family protein [Bacteroidales bacterium]
MTHIGLLSDTHGFVHPRAAEFFSICSEIWHAGDIGNIATADALNAIKPLRAVHGNIDDALVRRVYPELQVFHCEKMKVLMTHIGGYPGRYNAEARKRIETEKPGLFISGHSHILKVQYDQKFKLLHINPGAAGHSGWHRVITFVRFVIDGDQVRDLVVFEAERNTSRFEG